MSSAEYHALRLLEHNLTCSLSTASLQGKTEVSTVYFAQEKDFTFYFETLITNRKYQHLHTNPQVSMVVNESPHNLQMDGLIEELTGVRAAYARTFLCVKIGEEPVVFSNPNIRFFQCTPNWIRLRTKGTPPLYEMIRGEDPSTLSQNTP
jgi:hypothetical protein